MEKYSKISNKEKVVLFTEFCEALSVLNNSQEISEFLTDLLTKQESTMLAKRIKAAKLLIQGKNYREIQNRLKISQGTIAKINQWLMEAGEGFRLITERTKNKKIKNENQNLPINTLKKRYPIMFWPQLLIEDVIKTMNKKQKEKIRQSLNKLNHKSKLYKQLNKTLTV